MGEIKLKIASVVIGSSEGGGSGVAPYYTDLPDKPSINGETLSGDMTSEDLGLASESQAVPSGGTTGQVLAKKSNADNDVQWVNQESGGQGTTDYADLENKPKINNVTLSGNKTTSQLGLQAVLVSGTNIKTINSQTLLGSGNIAIEDGVTPHIDDNTKEWMIGEEHTGVDAEGKSAYQLYVTSVPQGETPMTEPQWLASLKANIGAFKFIDTVAAVQNQFENDGVGSVYTSSIDGVTADASTLSVILLMTTSGLSPEKTYMIATQDDGSSGYEFIYVGDLQSALPSNILTETDIADLREEVDDIANVLEMEVEKEMVTENVQYTTTNQYVANYNPPQINDNANYRLTNLIHFNKGETILYTGSTGSSKVVLVSRYENNSWTKLLVGDTNEATQSFEYTVTDDNGIDVYFCWYKTPDAIIQKRYVNKTITSIIGDIEQEVAEAVEDVQGMEEILDVRDEQVTTTNTLVLGTDYTSTNGYVGSDGTINTSSNDFKMSSAIELKAGDVLTVQASGPNSISIIASVASATPVSPASPLVIGEAWNSVKTYTYTAAADILVIVSWQVSNSMPDAVITLTATRTVKKSAITDLQEDVAELQDSIPSIEGNVDEIQDLVIEKVTDDCTTDVVSGKFIGHNGWSVTNSSFSYKMFDIKSGAVVKFTATAHQNMAAIAKYISGGATNILCEELVPATSTSEATFNYTSAEAMTIVVSFNNTKSASIEITTNTIDNQSTVISEIIGSHKTYNWSMMADGVDFGMMFDKIAVIGDSLASGRVEGIVGQSDAVGADFYNFSWLSFLAKRWRCSSFKNYSRAGQTTDDWITEWLPIMQADPIVYDAYFIALGTNNEYDESNPSGDQTNFNAFVQRFNSIIDDVRVKAPNAVIFIMSTYEAGRTTANATLRDIAETRMQTDDGVFYIDYANDAEYGRYSSIVNWRGHFSSTGYIYVASAINRIMNGIVWDNCTEEFWQQFAKYHNS